MYYINAKFTLFSILLRLLNTIFYVQTGRLILMYVHICVNVFFMITTGVGNIPSAALMQMMDHKDLGIHSELFSDVVVDLVEKGCVTNNKKMIHQGRLVATLLLGNQKLYDFVHNNPILEMLRVDYVNHPSKYINTPGKFKLIHLY